MRSVFELVKHGQTVHFTHADPTHLWYVTSEGVQFSVPVADIGEATFAAHDKALLFLRYLRPHWAAQTEEPSPVAMPPQEAPIRFTHYRLGQLWYATAGGDTFPVPQAAQATWPATAEAEDPRFVPHQEAHRQWIDQARQQAQA